MFVSVEVMFSLSEYITSITFPMQNGMDIEIPLDIKSRPTAPGNQSSVSIAKRLASDCLDN